MTPIARPIRVGVRVRPRQSHAAKHGFAAGPWREWGASRPQLRLTTTELNE